MNAPLDLAEPLLPAESALPVFSYASPDHGRMKRLLIHAIERATGQPRLKQLYLENQANPVPGESFFAAAVRHLRLSVNYDPASLAAIPATGPVVVVANHPYGVLDGIVLSHLVSLVRTDFKVLTNAVLYRAPELKDVLLPVDFDPTPQALATNLATRRTARDILAGGGCIVVFPGGAVSTAPRAFDRAVDPAWQPFTAQLAQRAQATVVPVFFEGQNSRLFQLASHLSYTLRVSLLFKEVRDRIGSTISVRIGKPISSRELAHLKDRAAFAAELRRRTYALGSARWAHRTFSGQTLGDRFRNRIRRLRESRPA